MKRITAYLQGKVGHIKAANKEKRIFAAINMARLNKEAEIAEAEAGIENCLSRLAEQDDIGASIQRIADLMEAKEEAERGIERLGRIKAMLEEDVKTEEDALPRPAR